MYRCLQYYKVTCWSAQRAVVEETIRRVVAAAAYSSSAVSVMMGLTLFVKVGSRGLWEDREKTGRLRTSHRDSSVRSC